MARQTMTLSTCAFLILALVVAVFPNFVQSSDSRVRAPRGFQERIRAARGESKVRSRGSRGSRRVRTRHGMSTGVEGALRGLL
jgi:hypothetical protein